MSSSVFIERNVIPKTVPNVMSSDSNLVVVYSKNGINLDQKSVETIIEEKSISTISVVRLTSPTPSMIDQEETERLEELERYNDDLSEDSHVETDDGDGCSSNEDNNKSDKDHVTGDDHESSQDEIDDINAADSVADIPKVRKKPGRKPKIVKKIKKRRKPKERPEIVGLSVEEFYADNIANELVKNALKIAGVPIYKRTAETDALLEIIKNDHNYTPFTSAEQMRTHKAAERLEAENRATQARKLIPLASNNLRNFNTKKKLHLQQTSQQAQVLKEKVKASSISSERLNSLRGNRLGKNSKEDEEYLEDDEDINSIHSNNAGEDDLLDNLESNEEYDESDLSDDSRFTDNDRDSDIDFNLYNRHATKRKRSKKSKRQTQQAKQQQQQQQKQQTQPIVQKPQIVRRIIKQNHEQRSDSPVKAAPVTNAVNQTFPMTRVTVRLSKSSTPQIVKIMSINKPTTAKATDLPHLNKSAATINSALSLPSPSPAPSVAAKMHLSTSLSSSPSPLIGVRRTPIVKVGVPSTTPLISSALSRSSQLLSSPKDVKEIVINKNLNSPKGVFTNLNTLLNESCASPTSLPNTVTKIKNTPPTGTTIITQSNESTLPTQLSSKGFMPIGVDTAASNQLPSQISIHTHQSSSELAAENERQLDLIDSIVKDELQKASLVEQQPPTTDENIPKLIKMLESTADVLDQQNNMQQQQQPTIQQPTINPPNQLNSFVAVPNVGPIVDDIDISNAPLLETPDDDITADFLQHVVGLIEDDKKFKEEIEKEVFGVPFSNEPMDTSINNSPIVVPNVERNEPVLIMPPLAIEQHNQSSSSLNDLQQSLQMINTVAEASPILPKPSNLMASTPNRNVNNDQAFTPVGTPRTMETQVQIVRGNGRVITLPPIEAPATRSRRRAQTSFNNDINSINYSESSLDGSVYSNASASITGNESYLQSRRKSIETNYIKRRASSREKASTPTTSRKSGGGRKRNASSQKKSKANASKKSVESELSESQDDDDDPNKLWCICRQPHHNRFMICCDACQDWFHGSCVGITKTIGRNIEEKGIEWTCPNCTKLEEEKKQPRITEMLQQHNKQNTSITPTPEVTEIPNKSNNIIERDPGNGSGGGEVLHSKQMDNNKSKVATPNAQNFTRPTNAANIQTKKINTISKMIPMSPKCVESSIVLHNNKLQATTPSANNTKLTPKPLYQQILNFPKLVTLSKPAVNNGPPCIVCKKPSRGTSIYCSDECIRKYANSAVQLAQHSTKVTDKEIGIANVVVQDGKIVKKKGLFEDMLLLADSVPKAERINVFERKTGRVLTGHNAPTVLNLKKWLQENPTFEVVQPGTPQAIEIEKRRRANHASSSSSSSLTVSKADISTQSVESEAAATSAQQQQPVNRSTTAAQQLHTTQKRLNKTENQIGNKTKEKAEKRNQTLDNSNKATQDSSFSKQKPEPIRLNVRRTFKEQLLLRIKEVQEQDTQDASIDNKALSEFSADNVEQFVKSVESEMYNVFGKDTGAKYKAKYRSLMFNIKDRKNKTLFAKICAKQIEPKQLVRMSPEELASQELAMWRANENKHQLEIIKKSEMDLLACNKNYVLKTHKGEEVIEGKSNDFLILDATLAGDVADKIVSKDLLSQSSDTPSKNSESKMSDIENSSSTSHKTTDKSKSKETTRDKEKGIDGRVERKHKVAKERDHKDNHQHHHHHHHHHHKSHSRKRSRSRSKSRSGDDKHRKIISHRDDRHTSSSHDRSREQSNDRRHDHQDRKGRDKEGGDHHHHHHHRHHEEKSSNSPERSRNHETEHVNNHKESHHKTEDKELASKKHFSSKAAKDVTKPEKPAQNTMESFNLVDQILKSVKTVEEAANLVKPNNKETNPIETEDIQSKEDPYILYAKKISSLLLWRGELNMVDVSCFNMSLYHLVGTSQKLGKVLQEKLEVVGRIYKETVWEYISKIKKSPTKEVVLVRLFPSSEEDVQGYKNLFDYLDTRQRLGVVGVGSEHIRDFYIFPLSAMKHVPPVLQTPNRVDFYEDAERPNILMGIIIRCVAKRGPSDKNTHSSSMASTSAAAKLQRIPQKRSNNSFTPPASPKRRRISSTHSSKGDEIDIDAIIKAPIASQSKRSLANKSSIKTKNDDDEPYSPGDSSGDDSTRGSGDEFKRKVEEINKQIAKQRKEIAGLLKVEPTNYDVPSTSSSVLANISIPPNLSKILASIKDKTDFKKMTVKSELPLHEEYNPEETILSTSSYTRATTTEKSSSSSGGHLSQLSEAELLSMVPDNIEILSPTEPSKSEEPPPPGV